MPLFFQQVIDDTTQLALWKIAEEEAFFSEYVPLQRTITHPHKRLQHLAGRYLLQFLVPDFPVSLIQIADTRKPFLQDEAYHFSISHCGDYVGVIVSKNKRVGIDIELVTKKIEKIQHKFVTQEEWNSVNGQWAMDDRKGLGVGNSGFGNTKFDITPEPDSSTSQLVNLSTINLLTLLWSCKEAAFKWYGLGEVDFKGHMEVKSIVAIDERYETTMHFKKNEDLVLDLHSRYFDNLIMSYIVT
jgi:phosphopantetheinyl transferase